MSTESGYQQYIHTLRNAYFNGGVPLSPDCFPPATVYELAPDECMAACYPFLKKRAAGIISSAQSELFDKFETTVFYFHNKKIIFPLINKEGFEWYSNANIVTYDFISQSFIGMHENAKVIYDIGGHQGVWTLYYAGAVGQSGRVHMFEPSIINIECAALACFANGIENVTISGIGIADSAMTLSPYEEGLLVAGISHKLNLLPLSQVIWHKPDFLKIDIEGYEYDLVKSTPHIFDMADNIYLELHIPFMQSRGLDYREIYQMIPFDRFRVRTPDNGLFRDIGPNEELDGFRAVMLTRLNTNSA
jgi:FkbM family methyltransferase